MIGVRDALAYPLRGDRRGDALVVSWVLLLTLELIPVLPLLLLSGVLVRTLGGSVTGRDAPPPVFEDARGLLRTSVGATATVVVYAGLPGGYLLLVLHVVSGGASVDPGSLLVPVAVTVGAIWLLVAAYLLPIGLAGYAATGSIRAAFDGGLLRRGARSGRYLLGWLVAVVVLDVGGLLVTSARGSSGLGGVLVALVAAYALLIAVRLLGRGVARSGALDRSLGNP